jgi:NitT/TauT family transport system substrate-binding protein
MRKLWQAALAAILLCDAATAVAEDQLKIAIGQKDNWENQMPALGQRAGFFKKQNIVLELLPTQGGGETMQAVISGSVDIGIGVGTLGVMSAFAKGAPIRVLAAAMTGSNDVYWYVPAASPIRSLKDAQDKTIAYSTNGSSTHNMVLAFLKELNLSAKPVGTGSPPSTFTQVMSGQVDIGWASPPFGLDAVEDGRIRIVGRGSDAASTRDQTVRVQVVNLDVLRKRGDVIARFMQAYRETLDWMYTSPEAIAYYADGLHIPEARARRARDEFYPKSALDPDRVSGLDAQMADGVNLKFLQRTLTPQELTELFQISRKSN